MTDEGKKLEHTESGSTTKDALDLGAPMKAAADPKKETVGPEDALDPNARGDYTGRLDEGASYQSQVVGHREDGSPIIKMVRQK